jgi:AraC-like DNA-binding protein
VEVYEFGDVEAVQSAFCDTYGNMRLTPRSGSPRARMTREVLGGLELHRLNMAMSFEVDVEGLEALTFARIVSGRIVSHRGTSTTRWGPGDLYLVTQPDYEFRAEVDLLDAESALLSLAAINQAASTAPGRRAEPIRFTGHVPITREAAARWTMTYDFVRDNAATAATRPLLASSLTQLLAAATLTTFPNTAVLEPTIEDSHDAHPPTVRRACTFIDENAHREVTTAEIAAAADVTIRTVQLAFKRHLETTPLAYLRRVRLERAHQQLLDAAPDSVSIADVAATWGFASHSHFTAAYRTAYGRRPSQTLRQR